MRTRSLRRPHSNAFRPTLEVLEDRRTPACTVSVGDFDATGTTDLLVTGDAANQVLTILDDNVDAIVRLDCNGDGDLVDAGDFNNVRVGTIESVDVQLGAGNDQYTYTLTGDFSGAIKVLATALGPALSRNVFNFNTAGYTIQDSSSILIDVLGGAQSDFTTIQFDAIVGSTVVVQEFLQGGNETGLVAGILTHSSVTFNGPVDAASVDVEADLGAGANAFRVQFLDSVGTLGPANININVYGSEAATEADAIVADFAGVIESGSTVSVNARLGGGDDGFRALFNLDTFGIQNTQAFRAGGELRLYVDGGTGNDRLFATRNGTEGPCNMDGTLELILNGGIGNDTITVDFGGPGALQSLVTTAYNRNFRLRVYGGAGADQIAVTLTDALSANFNFDVQILGGNGTDRIAFVGRKNGSVPRFNYAINPLGSLGFVFIDGGYSLDICTVAGDFPVRLRNTEAR